MKRLIPLLMTAVFFANCTEDPGELEKINDVQPQMVFTATPSSLPADGKTKAEILFRVTPSDAFRGRQVTFSITPIGTFSNGSNSQVLPLDQNGEARVFASSLKEGIAYVTASVGNTTASASVNFQKFQGLDTLILPTIRDSVAADNYSYDEVVAKTKTPGEIQGRQVSFTIDKGSFANGSQQYTVTFGIDSTVSIFVKHNRSEFVRLTATVNNSYSKQLNLFFSIAYPDHVSVDPDSLLMTRIPGNHTAVIARLMRSVGTASEGQTVNFYDSTDTGGSVGSFTNTTPSNNLGTASANYYIQDTSYKGYVYIKAYVQTPAGRVLGSSKILMRQ